MNKDELLRRHDSEDEEWKTEVQERLEQYRRQKKTGHNAPPREKSSRFKGVTRHHQSGKWQASINDGGDYFYAGLYPEEEQAARAFDISRLALQGTLPDKDTNFSVNDYRFYYTESATCELDIHAACAAFLPPCNRQANAKNEPLEIRLRCRLDQQRNETGKCDVSNRAAAAASRRKRAAPPSAVAVVDEGGGASTSTSVNATAKTEGRRVGAQHDGAPQPRKQRRRSLTNPVWFARKIRALNASLSPGARIAEVVQPGKDADDIYVLAVVIVHDSSDDVPRGDAVMADAHPQTSPPERGIADVVIWDGATELAMGSYTSEESAKTAATRMMTSLIYRRRLILSMRQTIAEAPSMVARMSLA